MKRWLNLPIFLLVTTFLCPGAPSPPNIVLILADDLGYSDLGCYGGEIRTPNLDDLASGGLRLTQLYNTSRCCSTRASLLTGLHAHQAGVGAMTADNGLPGYRGFLTDRCVTVAQLLKGRHYHTFLAGKWHLRGGGDPDCIPTRRGFDEFYGHFRAYASFWRPDLYLRLPEGRSRLELPGEFYATGAITDHAIHFIGEARKSSRPYFLFLAYNAPHFPLHAPKETIDRYEPVYRGGWDEIRTSRYRRMKETGILPAAFELPPRGRVPEVPERNRDSPWYGKPVPAWESLPANRRADLARRMATYAAMVEILDRNVGRVVDNLRENDELENTLILFLSDNGACAEWDPLGFDNDPYPANRLHEKDGLERMGQPGSFHSYGTGWANACNSPLRLYKHYCYEGGISSPCIVHWPEGMTRRGEIDRRPAHVTDLTATLLELGGASYPETWEGKPILPPAGISLLPLFRGEALPERPLFFEHEGNRAVRLGEWKLVWANDLGAWELYDMGRDRSETKDLAADHPEKVREMSRLWSDWAERSFVEKSKIRQPGKGMPTIHYLPTDEKEAARQIRELGGHAFPDLRSGRTAEINLNRNPLVNDATMELVRVCPDITDLSLEETAVGDAGLERIRGFGKLEWLNLFRTRITDRALDTIVTLPALRHLPAGETGITDAGMARILTLKKLRYLGLRGNAVTDRGIEGIGALGQLAGLHLGATGISDRALPLLGELKSLEKLWLHDTPVTGAAVGRLMEELPGLKELHLQRTHLEVGEVRELRARFPGCRILYENDG